ncbi:adenosylmethionine--8-amino-7-oxononanoate transaminase [Actinopolyspora saharensis]|uniref:adenosylmethionine--8-amino-7-oxononanoate transaminase n=1 Tax=Actinopolyspora saharensis TaxID=995062 RepID=UPI003F66FAB5
MLSLDAPLSAEELTELDRTRVWHPYTTSPTASPQLLVESASGVRLRLAAPVRGVEELVDGMSSWWAAVHGYAHPELDAAAHAQVDRMSHVMFGGLTNESAVRLAATLTEITPAGLNHVFLADSGSVSVEVALKMCLQYWRGLGRPDKRRLLTWRGGYHGDTWHPMSVCDPEGGMHHLWSGLLNEQVFAEAPPEGFDAEVDEAYLGRFERLLRSHAEELAAIVVEPVVQGAGGMRFHAPEYLRRLRELADRYEVLLVHDEIATGFGRTGELFAADHAGVTPDVMCLGKALTGGYLTMAATVCGRRVAEGIAGGDVPVLAHGPTFMGNPLAAAVANASLRVLFRDDWRTRVRGIAAGLEAGLAPAREMAGVRDVRVLGAVGVIQLDHEVDVAAASAAAIERGVWLRPFRDLIYTMPPYVIDAADLGRVTDAAAAAARVG